MPASEAASAVSGARPGDGSGGNPGTSTAMPFSGLLAREQALSAAINGVLSALFFALMFGLTPRLLANGAPDHFARDFLPQGLMVALMGALVPALVVRARLRREGRLARGAGPDAGAIARAVGLSVLGGLASGGALFALALVGPYAMMPLYPALLLKIVYGAVLGTAVTRAALIALYAGRVGTDEAAGRGDQGDTR
ncbi:hypothetical protein MTR62_13595 [Novosphingobium sp. 1949]|uniref:Uncharacterized protein n=1 Tax=Novosphingobium organovorum TaxID=2930092 RepID=A0ABT0BF99_9SPHN|nr:hypothetical protein [Novosphingobium organovorum]MCJ2183716.1 hypothetical protein [Novosphingobium organovorum]